MFDNFLILLLYTGSSIKVPPGLSPSSFLVSARLPIVLRKNFRKTKEIMQ